MDFTLTIVTTSCLDYHIKAERSGAGIPIVGSFGAAEKDLVLLKPQALPDVQEFRLM